jgi:hypothetical protein
MDSSPAIDARMLGDLCEVEVEQLVAVYDVCPQARELSDLPPVVQRMVGLFDGQRTLLQVCQETGLGLAKGQAVAAKLVGLGVLQPAPAGDGRAFDELEEAFFASEVQPIDEADDEVGPSLAEKVRRLLNRVRLL